MSVAGFEAFANAVSEGAAAGSPPAPAPRALSGVAVLGGGDDARMFAALALAEGCAVTLFSAYGRDLDEIRAAGSVTLRGDGPIGSFHVDPAKGPGIALTGELDRAAAGADALILTGPIHKQRTYAMVLADHLRDGQVLALPNARSLGAVEVAWLLQAGGCEADISIVEMAGAPYWIRREGAALSLSACPPAPAAVLPQGRGDALEALRGILPNMLATISCVHSGFADASGAVELPAILLGGPGAPDGGPDIPEGGTPIAANDTFRNLIGPRHRALIARLWDERRAVARGFGVRDLPDADAAIAQCAGARAGPGSRPVPATRETAEMIRAGVIGSLIPLISAARLVNAPVPATEAMATLAATMLDRDLDGAGRRLETIGVTAADVSAARRQFDALMRGRDHG